MPPAQGLPLWGAAVVVVLIAAALLGAYWLFRRARRPDCAWPRPWRLAAQGPGWLLAATGGWLALLLARQEIREHRVGLGTGIVVAGTLALIKGLLIARATPASPRPPQTD